MKLLVKLLLRADSAAALLHLHAAPLRTPGNNWRCPGLLRQTEG